MSYEGYTRALCKNGHLKEGDFYFFEPEYEKCRTCGEKFIWQEGVDQTNGDEYSYHTPLEINTPAEYKKCKHCGGSKLIKKETYKIPSPDAVQVNVETGLPYSEDN